MTTRAARITLTIKLTVGKDDDLITWVTSLPKGSRQSAVKRVLREAIRQIEGEEDTLTQIGQDTAWVRAALSEMPLWMEGLLSRVTVVQSPKTVLPDPRSAHTGQLSTESVTRREKRIAKATW